jgi:thioredoxin reductase
MQDQSYDVAIVGAGPAGLQAALVLARTRKKIIVFDSPQPPRNNASHGVHNFLGLDGLLPAQIREQAWQQIDVYGSTERRTEQIVDVQQAESGHFSVLGEDGSAITARHVMLAVGYHDIYPDVPGFSECWGHTIIPCPFCDGYENRDRVWGIVPLSEVVAVHLPVVSRNWTSEEAMVFLPDHISISPESVEALAAKNIALHYGDIRAVHHTGGSLEAVTLNTGERVNVGTLLWHLPEAPTELTQKVIANFDLALDEKGHIATDATSQTAIKGLWAVGDIKGWAGSIGAAFAGGEAAATIVREWYT